MQSRHTLIILAATLAGTPGGQVLAEKVDTGGQMEEVVVVASKIERPLWRVAAQVTTLYKDELEAQMVRDLGDIARYQPAIEADFAGTRFGSTGLAIRGIGGNRVAMEFDGVPLPRHFEIGEFANNSRHAIDPAIIERIEILRGPASSLYGSDAIGGVVAITSTEPKDLVATGENHYLGAGGGYASADNSTLGHVTYGYSGDNHGVALSFNYRTGHELDNQAIATATDRIDHNQREMFAKWTYFFENGGRLRTIVDRYNRDVDSDLKSVLGFGRQFGSTVSLIGTDTQERNRASVDYTIADIAGFDLASLTIYQQDNESGQATTDTRADRTTLVPNQVVERLFSFREAGLGLEGKARKDFSTGSADHILVTGMEWNYSKLTESRDGLSTNLVTGATTKVLPPGETLPQRDLPRSDTDSLGVYLQDEIQFGALTLIPAIRWDRFKLDASTDDLFTDPGRLTDLDDDNVSLRFGVTRRMSDHLALFLHYAEGFRSPPAEDVNLFLDYRGFVNVRALPNPDLKAEQSKNHELGARINYEGTAIALGAYHSTFDNFIESRVNVGVDPSDGTLLFQSRNISNARIYGFEAEFDQQLGVLHPALAAWRLDAGFHWSKGENRDTDAPINLVNPAKAVLGLHFLQSETISASLRARHYSRQNRVDFSDGEFFVAPSQVVIDLSARWAPRPSIEIVAGVYNLTDARYWRYGDVRMFDPSDPRVEALTRPGRNASVTVYFRQ